MRDLTSKGDRMMSSRDRVALITGATGAVGAAIAARLVSSNAVVCLVGRTQHALDDLVRARGWKDHIDCYPVDLAHDVSIDAFVERFRANHQVLDIVVHAAGTISLGAVQEARVEDFDDQYRINVRAPFRLTQALLPLIAACRGQIVLVNSTQGFAATAGVAQYAATKHALKAFADSLRDEVNPQGVRVLSIFLGRTASRMQEAVHQHEGKDYHPERLIQPDDVASIVLNAIELPRTIEVTEIRLRPMLKA